MRKVIVLAAGAACFGIASSARAQQADFRQNRATCVQGFDIEGEEPSPVASLAEQNMNSLASRLSEIVSSREAVSRNPRERAALAQWLSGHQEEFETIGLSGLFGASRPLRPGTLGGVEENPLATGFVRAVNTIDLRRSQFYSAGIRNAPMPDGQIEVGRFRYLMTGIRARIEQLESCRHLRSAKLLLVANREQGRLARLRAEVFERARGKEQRNPEFRAASAEEEERWAATLKAIEGVADWQLSAEMYEGLRAPEPQIAE